MCIKAETNIAFEAAPKQIVGDDRCDTYDLIGGELDRFTRSNDFNLKLLIRSLKLAELALAVG